MHSIACNNSNGPHESGSSLPTALQMVAALTEEQHHQLHEFAVKRMRRLRNMSEFVNFTAGKSPMDFVHEALHKLLLGDSHPKKGRRLSAKNRSSSDAFLRCVMGIINSDLSNAVRDACRFPYVPAHDSDFEVGMVNGQEWSDTTGQTERRDLQRELFARLEPVLQTEPALAPVIRYWSDHFQESDRIGGPGMDPNLVYRVRQHARRILRELAEDLQAGPVRGREIVVRTVSLAPAIKSFPEL
jgi:hypothetical protein